MLVHNAGVALPGPRRRVDVDEWRATMEVNVVGAVALTLALLPALRAAGGHVVFINSGAGRNAVARAGVVFGEQVRAARRSPTRCAPTSRRCGSPRCYPGRIDTEMQRDLVAYEGGDYDPSGS